MTRVVENLVTKTTLDTSGLAAGAQQAVAIFNQLGNTIGKVQGLVLPGIAGLGAAFGSRAALNQFKDYRETGDDGMSMRAKGAKEYEEAVEAAHAAVGHLAAVIGQQLAPGATTTAEAFATIVGYVENITVKTVMFAREGIDAVVAFANSWVEAFDFVGNSWDGVLSAMDAGFAFITAIANNWKDIFKIAFLSAELGVVQFASQAVYLLVEVIPKILTWLAGNWRDVFYTIFDLVTTVLINLGTNIRNFFAELWNAINGNGFDFKFVGLTEGFRSTLKSLPDIAEREMGPLEKSIRDQLNAQIDATVPKIDRDMRTSQGSFRAGVDAFGRTVKDFVSTPIAGGNLQLVPDGVDSSTKSVGALAFGSKEAYSAILKATNGGSDYQQRQLNLLQEIRDAARAKAKKAKI